MDERISVVFVRHPHDSKHYLFSVPSRTYLNAGTLVMADTIKGQNEVGICVCDSFAVTAEQLAMITEVQPEYIKPIKAYFCKISLEE